MTIFSGSCRKTDMKSNRANILLSALPDNSGLPEGKPSAQRADCRKSKTGLYSSQGIRADPAAH